MSKVLTPEEKIAENEKLAKSFISEVVIPAFQQFVDEVNNKKKHLHAELRTSSHVAHVVINEGSEDFFDLTVEAKFTEHGTRVAVYNKFNDRGRKEGETSLEGIGIQKTITECSKDDLYRAIRRYAEQFLNRNNFYKD